MALLSAPGCPGLRLPPAMAHFRRGARAVASVRAVDWEEATNTFFDERSSTIYAALRRKLRYEALQSDAGQQLLQRSGRASDDISSCVCRKEKVVCKIGSCIEDHGIFGLAFSPACILSAVCASIRTRLCV